MNKKSVSIITIGKSGCGYNIIFDIICNQTYQNIIEWIVIDNSKEELPDFIINNSSKANFIIKHIISPLESDYKSIAHNMVKGDIILWMDTDEYYLPYRIEHMVDKLEKSNSNIINSPNIFVHDLVLNKTVKVNNFNSHTTVAYYKEFLTSPNIPIITIEETIVKIIGSDNTSFRDVMIACSIQNNIKGITKLEDTVIKHLIPTELYDQYIKLFINNNILPYDIVYFTGGHTLLWDPTDMSLGGSEQAITNLSENWVKMGKKVVVYGNFNKDMTVNGVDYLLWYKFPFEKKMKTLIVWRHCGIMMLMHFPFTKPDKLIMDFHDNFSYTLGKLEQTALFNFLEHVDNYNLKSNYHKLCLEEFLGKKLNNTNIIMNGVRVDKFIKNNNYIRNPYRFCYCSSYDRGLEVILEKIWPYIYAKEPLAELHVYYGMEHIEDTMKSRIRILLGQPGVMDHGRQPLDMIVREKYMSTFHIYLNQSTAEIDCISIRESLVTGCIPVISKFGVFAERAGLMYDFNESDIICKGIADDIILKMYDNNFVMDARKQLILSDTIIDWEHVAKEWIKGF